jgi:hypothetical protein
MASKDNVSGQPDVHRRTQALTWAVTESAGAEADEAGFAGRCRWMPGRPRASARPGRQARARSRQSANAGVTTRGSAPPSGGCTTSWANSTATGPRDIPRRAHPVDRAGRPGDLGEADERTRDRDGDGNGFAQWSGTSFSAAMVAGERAHASAAARAAGPRLKAPRGAATPRSS